MDKFIIDRQQGQAIWIDVKRGKVRNCYNGGETFDAKMNELYKGKSITFLKEDFETKMEGIYCNVRPENVLVHKQIIHAIKTRISDCNGKISMLQKTIYHDQKLQKEADDKIHILRGRRDDLKENLIKAEERLQTEIDRIASEHNYHVTPIPELI